MDRIDIKSQRKKKRRRRIIFFLIIPLLLITLSLTVYGTYLYKKAEEALSGSYNEVDGRDKSALRDEKVDPNIDNVSILFIGVDESETRDFGDTTRSDALMLATLNNDTKSVKLVSIPRDSYTYIPEVGYNTKINHAHAFGGPKATIETVENLFDIPVDYYVKMNFHAFIDVIDALNGIEVDVPYEITEQNSKDEQGAIQLDPGEQTLDGEEALAYARTRKQDNDIERGKRQQEVLQAIMKKATTAGGISKYDEVIEAIGDNMATDIPFSEMKSFLKYGTSGKVKIDPVTLEGQDDYIDGVYYYALDETALEEVKATLKSHLEVSKSELDPLVQNDPESDERSN
ncbi:LytR family transcriptional regulator [Rossellomorea vietnamensis]|uniref:LytR family transcriptional regulator n=1 Tax=Rossellomorea vietnamensis TaxID=218284 RepID=A0A5D4KFD8_9BACI|nr:LCP family protein [Rossellomorea vietnamensis]TYR76021.1 LytR family transcriptional regulator [Rossellomorea vietnamensis]